MLASMAVENGWAGLVINGCIRDSKIINELDIGVKALGTHPLKSIKDYKGERGKRVTFAGVEFVPGQWLYSDEVSCISNYMYYYYIFLENEGKNILLF